MSPSITRNDLEARVRETFERKASSLDTSHFEFDPELPTRFAESMSAERDSRRRLAPALVAALVVVVLVAAAVIAVGQARDDAAPAAQRTYRMVPSDRTVLPAQVVTVVLHGPGVETWSGGGASYFDRRRRDGSWQRLYMLEWYGGSSLPFYGDRNSGVNLIPVEATPFKALIPPVKPGEYRITRTFDVSESSDKTLSTRVTVKSCPQGESPVPVTDPALRGEGFVTGMCARPLRANRNPALTYRMVPSDRTVLPGQIVTVTVEGPGSEASGGGVDSYFERQRKDGSWQRLYMLVWYGRGEPYVDDPNSGIDDLGVQASPFEVVIPAVEPGVYRITRRFLVSPGYTSEERILSTRVTVEQCPRGQDPVFVRDPSRGLGKPECRAPVK